MISDPLEVISRVMADSVTPDGIRIAIVAGAATVLAAAIPAILPIGRRETSQQRRERAREERMHRQLDRALEQATELEAVLRQAQAEIDRLELLCWASGVNPHPPVNLRRADDDS